MSKLVLLSALLLSNAAHAASHRVNIQPVREFIEAKLMKPGASKLKLTNKLDAADMKKGGISQSARLRALSALGGYVGFGKGRGYEGGVYVVKMGKSKLLVTQASANGPDSTRPARYHFSVRTAKNGLVIARGSVQAGQIKWTRSHNNQTPGNPAERNDAR